ncbi:hypothetical protein IEO21_10433 [Rhodonia placenta]|uniref:Uncharacterized protein n=1 Tax=Rhodonia placenta TaxID=104341 RepID=A0A8H7TWZ3_9APHY|nr:hypothetical protein IEO21_10433 [Postia placenta]
MIVCFPAGLTIRSRSWRIKMLTLRLWEWPVLLTYPQVLLVYPISGKGTRQPRGDEEDTNHLLIEPPLSHIHTWTFLYSPLISSFRLCFLTTPVPRFTPSGNLASAWRHPIATHLRTASPMGPSSWMTRITRFGTFLQSHSCGLLSTLICCCEPVPSRRHPLMCLVDMSSFSLYGVRTSQPHTSSVPSTSARLCSMLLGKPSKSTSSHQSEWDLSPRTASSRSFAKSRYRSTHLNKSGPSTQCCGTRHSVVVVLRSSAPSGRRRGLRRRRVRSCSAPSRGRYTSRVVGRR